MTRPKQDTRITSFLTLFEPLQNKDLSKNLYHKETTEEDIIMDTTSMCENSKGRKERLKTQQLEDTTVNDNNTVKDNFPWLPKFSKVIHSSIGSRNYRHLERSLLLYTQHITSSMALSNVKSGDVINLKSHINNMLIFFHWYWLDIKQDITDHNSYLNRMSALLNVYIDIELKTSTDKRCSGYVKDSSKIAAKILAALYIYLNNSEEHIFRVLLRIQHATERYAKICDHLFMKSFTNLTTKMTSMTDIAYVRYLLAFKMWKKMAEDYDRKGRINKLALMLLGLRMPKLRDELLKFVPRPPVNQENETLWLLQSNLFDLKQSHKYFLQFEDEMDNPTNSQCIKTIHADQSCSEPQKNQVNPLPHRSNSNGDASNHEVNKDHSGVLPNRNPIPGIDGNKSMDQTYLQKKGTKSLKPLKKMRKKPRKTIIIDLTGDDEISVPYKVKRKKTKQKLGYLKIMKKKHKLQKHINTPKDSSRLMDADTQACSNNISKSSDDKVRLECKPISDNKVNDGTENCVSMNSKSSSNDTNCVNLQKNEHTNVAKSPMSNICPEFVKEDEMQHDYNSHSSKTLKLVDQNIKEFKVTADLSRENKMENHALPHVTYAAGNAIDSYSNSIMQGKEALTSQEDSAMETMPLFRTCQSNIVDQHSFKQELPTSTNCSAIQKSHKCCNSVPIDMNDIKHLIIKKLKSINDHSSQITEIIKQKVCHRVNECPNCCTKIDCKPFVFTSNDVLATKAQDLPHNTFSQNGNDAKSACNTNIIYMLNERDKRIYVVNHIGERAVAAHTEKGVQCLEKSNDMHTVSTTFVGDKIVETPLYSQHVGLDNARTSDYGNAVKYSEITMKEQQRRNNCDTSIPNDQMHSSEFCMFDINSFEVGSNAEIDYETQLKNSLKAEDINEITKTLDCIDDAENISFLNNIQSESLEDFFRQSSTMSLINYDNASGMSTKKPLVCTDNDVIAMKTHDTLHNMFDGNENDVKSTRDANTIYMLNDRNKCVYTANQTGESVAAMDADKRVQCLDNPNDMCTVSTTFIEDQIVGSLLDGQHVNFETMRLSDYGNDPKYSEAMMKEQGGGGGGNCDTSMSSDRLHSSESCTFDMNSFDIDSKEANEIMKTDCIDGLENISFLHNIESLEETLDDVLRQPSLMSQMNCDGSSGESKDLKENLFSDDIADFLSLKQSPFDFDNVYCNVLSDVPAFKQEQELQPPAQHEFFFTEGDRKATSPKQFEKVSWAPGTSWYQPSCSWCLV
ncbi:uncharacterized protein LOC105182089 isoform X1 [Harpegnathos saltator]|nr:uncharacterized protein LOC105182089 isoform X1 [Harpegnathos saltator]XP_025158361.1 uncharacterized protein LOC105182089 isoform X1 [Harpegnathos saltator]XP_025158362.1 uncharacterized protein LOC105182089 isoform X1 [Harpegnathos saltator]